MAHRFHIRLRTNGDALPVELETVAERTGIRCP